MNVLVDTNVWLDIFSVRAPFAQTSGRAVLHSSAQGANLEAIVTRDTTGFDAAELRVYTPKELISAVSQ